MAQNATGYAVLLADSDGVVMDTLAEPVRLSVRAGGDPAGQSGALRRWYSCRRRCALPSAAKRWRRAMATKRSPSPQTAPASDAADATTRTFEARYVLEGPLANAPLGATVTLHIKKQSGESQVMQVPLAALYDAGKGPGVWRISAQPARVAWQPVKVLSVGEEAAQVTAR